MICSEATAQTTHKDSNGMIGFQLFLWITQISHVVLTAMIVVSQLIAARKVSNAVTLRMTGQRGDEDDDNEWRAEEFVVPLGADEGRVSELPLQKMGPASSAAAAAAVAVLPRPAFNPPGDGETDGTGAVVEQRVLL